jgi:predicted permease
LSDRDPDPLVELESHLAHRVDDLVRSGLSREEAERRARVEFGSVERYREEAREAARPVGVGLSLLWRDVVFAPRRLRASPMFTLFAVTTLAVGIGITTAVYSLIYSLIWQPAGVRDPDRLIAVRQVVDYTRGFSGREYDELRQRLTAFSGTTAFAPFSSALSAPGTAQLIAGEAVDGEFFRLLGVQPLVGRLIGPGDDRPDAPAVVVLAENVWRRLFGGDRGVVGRSVRMADRVFTIIGVVPSEFRSASRGGRVPLAAWVPLSVAPGLGPGFGLDVGSPNQRVLSVIGRLREGHTIEQARAALQLIGQQFDAMYPLTSRGQSRPRTMQASRAFENEDLRLQSEGARVILGLPALVLLIACTNLANLVLSRGASRRHEFAVRRALGASRWRLVREQLLDGAVIAVAGGLGGVWIARQLLRFGMGFVRETFGGAQSALLAFEPELAPPVIAAAGCCALLSLVVASLIPALQLTRDSDRVVLSNDTGTGAAPRWRGRSNLIAVQVAVSVCLYLLTAAGVTWLRDEWRHVLRPSLDGVVSAEIPFSMQQRDEMKVRRTIERILAELRRHPEIAEVAVGGGGYRREDPIEVVVPGRPFIGRGLDLWAGLRVASPALPDLLGDRIEAGRTFGNADHAGAGRVVIVNRSLALRLFGPGDHLGKQVVVREPVSASAEPYTMTIVGITGDRLDRNGRPEPLAYAPFTQRFAADLAIFVRARSDAEVDALEPLLHRAIRSADPDLAVTFIGRADRSRRWTQAAVATIVTSAAGALATIALGLSMAGLFGVLSHVVSRRTREFGVRMALGADRARITRLVLRDGSRPVLEGLVIGLGAAFAFAMMIQTDFTRDITLDPVAFLVAAGPLLVAAAVACYLPARRASAIDPNVALKDA